MYSLIGQAIKMRFHKKLMNKLKNLQCNFYNTNRHVYILDCLDQNNN